MGARPPWQRVSTRSPSLTLCAAAPGSVCCSRYSSRAQPPRGETAAQEPVHTWSRRERLFLAQCFVGKGLPSGAKPQTSSRAWKALIAPSRSLRRDIQQTKKPEPHQGSQRTVNLSALRVQNGQHLDSDRTHELMVLTTGDGLLVGLPAITPWPFESTCGNHKK